MRFPDILFPFSHAGLRRRDTTLPQGQWLSGSPRLFFDCTAVKRRVCGMRGLPLKPRGSRPGA